MRLKGILDAKGMNASQLAKLLGVSQPYVSQLMTGKLQPSIKQCIKIAKALDVPLAALFEGYGETLVCPHCGMPIHITK